MSIKEMSDKIRVQDRGRIREEIEGPLKRRYGRGVFVQDHTESSDGALFITLGNASPQDVSDRRDHDRVLKFIEYNDVYTLVAEPTDRGYLIELPDRDDVYGGFRDSKRALARRLDRTMAQAIYRQLVHFPSVKNQLGAIQSILRTVWEEGRIDQETIHQVRGTAPKERKKTKNYLKLLEDTRFFRIGEDGSIRSGPELDSFDLNEVERNRFNEVVLGQVVEKAYSTLKDELNITLLAHYPKYANAYYFTALERHEPDVRLDAEAARDSLESLYGENEHEIKVRQKLDDLSDVGVLKKDDGGFYRSERDVFETLTQRAPA